MQNVFFRTVTISRDGQSQDISRVFQSTFSDRSCVDRSTRIHTRYSGNKLVCQLETKFPTGESIWTARGERGLTRWPFIVSQVASEERTFHYRRSRVISAHLRGCFGRIRSRFVGYSPLSILAVWRACVVCSLGGNCRRAAAPPQQQSSLFGTTLTCFVNNSRGEWLVGRSSDTKDNLLEIASLLQLFVSTAEAACCNSFAIAIYRRRWPKWNT